MEQKNKIKGITLIALVITIIVLLILAGISIATLTGENGIIEKAQKAKEATQIAQYTEELQIIGLGLQPDRTIDKIETQEYMNLYEEKIRNDDIFEGYQEITQLSYLDEITIQIITKEGYVFWVTEDDVKFIGGREDIPPIPQKELYASVKGNTLTFSDNEEVAKANADNEASYWNITDQVYTRSGWGSNSVVTTPWFASKDKIEIIDFKTIVQPTNMDNYFCHLTQLTKIEGIENLRTNATIPNGYTVTISLEKYNETPGNEDKKEAIYEVLNFLYEDENIQTYLDDQSAVPCKKGDFELPSMLDGMKPYIENDRMADYQDHHYPTEMAVDAMIQTYLVDNSENATDTFLTKFDTDWARYNRDLIAKVQKFYSEHPEKLTEGGE